MNSMEQAENPAPVADPLWVASREGRLTRGPTEVGLLKRPRLFALFRFDEWAFSSIARSLFWSMLVLTEVGAVILLYLTIDASLHSWVELRVELVVALLFYMLLAPVMFRMVHDLSVLGFGILVAWLRLLERRTWG